MLEEQPPCGDGITEGDEECDDGNIVNGDDCSSSCTIEEPASCGDGSINQTREECDNGDNNGEGTCTIDCIKVISPYC